MFNFDPSLPLVALGVIFGIGYALLGIGLVLAYRSSGFINFAHGAVGLVSAAMMSVVVNDYGVPYWIGFAGALVVAALLSAGLETVVVQKLVGVPKVLPMVATLGTAQALLLLALSFSGGGLGGSSFPHPPFFPDFDLAAYISPSASALVVLSPIVVAGLYYFFQRTHYGLAVRAAAANPDAATLSGVNPRHMSMLSWAIAGALSAFAAMLLLPNQSTVTPDTLGPDFIVRGLVVATLARFANLPVAFVAGVGLGVLEQVINTNPNGSGYFEVALFLLVVIGVALQARGARQEQEPWHRFAAADPLPDRYQEIFVIRNLGWLLGGAAAVGAALLPLWITNQAAFVISSILALAIIGMSVSFLTGLAGQLSLGQVAFAGIGAVAAVRIGTQSGSVLAGLLAGGVAGAVTSTLVGLPALRVRGLQLAIATLAFALATFNWLLRQDWALGSGRSSRPISLLGRELTTSKSFYLVALALFVIVLTLASAIKLSPFGQSLLAIRDNENAARVFRIAPQRTTLMAYAFSGMIAGLGGALMAFANTFVTRALFTPSDSINVVSIAVIGGLSQLSGPLLGAFYLVGIPGFFDLELSALAGLNAFWLILILEQPLGISGLLATTHRRLTDQLARWHGIDPVLARDSSHPESAATPDPVITAAQQSQSATKAPDTSSAEPTIKPLLVVDEVSKRFGSVVAVRKVSLSVNPGETLGLIGPNGAGKTTLFELISGFVRPDSGSVIFDGVDVSKRRPEQRSALGMVRSFQNATLFPTMTTREVMTLAYNNGGQPSNSGSSGTGSSGTRSSPRDRADEAMELFGLAPLADQSIKSLSTGTRRIVELAANVALEPRLLLLDEPSAGVAQAETETLGHVIQQIGESRNITFVVIEHDMPMLATICNRMVALEIGSIIAEGTPAQVQADERVVRSYLGADPTAIARSGEMTSEPTN